MKLNELRRELTAWKKIATAKKAAGEWAEYADALEEVAKVMEEICKHYQKVWHEAYITCNDGPGPENYFFGQANAYADVLKLFGEEE